MGFWSGQRSAADQQNELAQIYERYAHILFKRCRRWVDNDEDTHEIIQEIFCLFWRDRKKFRGDSSVFTYLYRMATNRSIDSLRRRTRRGDPLSLDDTRLSDQHPDGIETLSQLAHLTEGLDEEALTVAVLIYVEGLTQEEVAEQLHKSRRTIGKKLKLFHQHTGHRQQMEGKLHE
jgi:RNA polymerase sigma factor (sigma-70 family)